MSVCHYTLFIVIRVELDLGRLGLDVHILEVGPVHRALLLLDSGAELEKLLGHLSDRGMGCHLGGENGPRLKSSKVHPKVRSTFVKKNTSCFIYGQVVRPGG